jgi:predicted PurR-regulated permease PerM
MADPPTDPEGSPGPDVARSADVDPVALGSDDRRAPRWVWRAVALFWIGYLVTLVARFTFGRLQTLIVLLLVSLFLALAVEPGVNALVARGVRRGRATGLILLGILAFVLVFVVAIGTLVGSQVADLLQNSEDYVNRTVEFLNDNFGTNIDPQEVNDAIADPDGPVQEFIKAQQDEVLRLSVTALGVLLQLFTVLLFTFYLVADGPRLRRSICSRLRPEYQRQVLDTWELAIVKTGGYLSSRGLLALLSAFFHWVVLQALGTPAPVALALWVGLVSQFLPVIGTYLAGVLPVLLTFIDSPTKALVLLGFIIVYQQIENYLFSPRITARTMELHPAVAFGAALGGAALIGPIGAVLALPAVAMLTAIVGAWGIRHDVVESHLTTVHERSARRWFRRAQSP